MLQLKTWVRGGGGTVEWGEGVDRGNGTAKKMEAHTPSWQT